MQTSDFPPLHLLTGIQNLALVLPPKVFPPFYLVVIDD